MMEVHEVQRRGGRTPKEALPILLSASETRPGRTSGTEKGSGVAVTTKLAAPATPNDAMTNGSRGAAQARVNAATSRFARLGATAVMLSATLSVAALSGLLSGCSMSPILSALQYRAELAAAGGGYSVSYNGNQNTAGSAPVDANRYVDHATVTVLGNSGSLARSGYTFNNWNTAADGSGSQYAAGDTFRIAGADVGLFAQWNLITQLAFGNTQHVTITSGHSDAIATADLNDDGTPDLINLDSYNGHTNVWMNLTTSGSKTVQFGTVTNYSMGSTGGVNYQAVDVGDLNKDKETDIAVSYQGTTSGVTVYFNTATSPGSFSRNPVTVSYTPYDLKIADIDGDGQPDLVAAASRYVMVLDNHSSGATPLFTEFDFGSISGTYYGLATGDINADGKVDVVAVDDTNQIAVLLNQSSTVGTPVLSKSTVSLPAGGIAKSVLVVDINGDGKPDIVTNDTAGSPPDTIHIFLNETVKGATSPTFSAAQDFTTVAYPGSVIAGDFNGDGRPDLAVMGATASDISVFVNTTATGSATASFATEQTVPTDSGAVLSAIGTADLNADSKADLIAAEYSMGKVGLVLNATSP